MRQIQRYFCSLARSQELFRSHKREQSNQAVHYAGSHTVQELFVIVAPPTRAIANLPLWMLELPDYQRDTLPSLICHRLNDSRALRKEASVNPSMRTMPVSPWWQRLCPPLSLCSLSPLPRCSSPMEAGEDSLALEVIVPGAVPAMGSGDQANCSAE
jgi:hypothetical protein